jgi:stalled ribosome alternative rescue factor ArfA
MRRNPVAKALRLGINRPQAIRPRKGKGSYKRKERT